MNSKDLKCIDRISSLPDDVLCHILSFLPTKYAVATSILSTRCKHLSSLVPNIDLSDHYAGMRSLSYAHCQDLIVAASFKFMQFVCKVLMARGLPNIRSITRFCLNSNIKYDQNILDKWILFVLLLNVRELDLWVQLEESNTLPCEIFKCKSLEVLKLGAEFLLNVPDSAVLPNLKALNLHFIEIIDDASIRKLLSSCPVLEDLRLYGCRFRESNIIEIAHPLLKNLLLSHAFDEYYYIFDTPNLQNLLYNSYGDSGVLVKNMKSLALAHIAWGSTEKQLQQYEDNDSENLLLNSVQGTTFINEMHNVRYLYLAGCSLNAVYFSNCLMATFQNLTVMELGSTHFSGWLVLPELLAKSPNLEVVVFTEVQSVYSFVCSAHQGFIDRYALKKEVDYCLPDSKPVCFSCSLKEIKVADFDGHECEFELLEYFLKSVQVLERMMIGSQVSSKSPFGFSISGRPWNGLKEPPEWVLPTCKRLSAAPRCSEAS